MVEEKNLYNLKYGSYFIISNQFWKHKDHLTAFKAIKALVAEGVPVKLICTGNRTDYRFPEYSKELDTYISENNLQEHIIFLGMIPKNEQIRLLTNSIALIQPTLFEGGPGGGGCI